jgi:surface antigen
MLRKVLLASALFALPLAAAAVTAHADTRGGKCEQDQGKKRRNSTIGGMFGSLASRVGVPTSVAGVGIPTTEILSEAITALLDCKEQQQAATATNEAIRGGVGTTSTWQSESRPGVSGSSSVTGEQQAANGTRCMTVTDVVIVDGEETTVPKKMCREPGASGWKRV